MARKDLDAWDAEAEVIRAARDEVLRRRRRSEDKAALRAPLEARIAELRLTAGPRRPYQLIELANLEDDLRRLG